MEQNYELGTCMSFDWTPLIDFQSAVVFMRELGRYGKMSLEKNYVALERCCDSSSLGGLICKSSLCVEFSCMKPFFMFGHWPIWEQC